MKILQSYTIIFEYVNNVGFLINVWFKYYYGKLCSHANFKNKSKIHNCGSGT